jgi:hypothetical protein
MRMAPYIVGMMTAFVHRTWKANQVPSWVTANTGYLRWTLHAVFAASWLNTTFYGALPDTQFLYSLGISLSDTTTMDPDTAQMLPSGAACFFVYVFNRFVFGCSVAYFVLMALNQRARVFNQLLSLQVWVPFARLSYSAYLLQLVGATWAAETVKLDYDSTGKTFGAFLLYGIVQCATVFSMAIGVWLAVEKPAINFANWLSKSADAASIARAAK